MPSVAKMADKIVNGTPVEEIAAGFKPLGRVRERDFRALWSDPALSMAEIGRRLGISGPAVRDRARARGLLPRTRSKARLRLTEAQQALFTLLYTLEAPSIDIAFLVRGKTGTRNGSAQFVIKYRKHLGLPGRGRGWRTAVHIQGLLRDARVQEMMARIAAPPPHPGEPNGQP